MSFSADQFVSRLNTLEDSQESIGNAAKWLLSQYREAPQVAEFWKNYMLKKDINTRRKLLAIYLMNHVVQQAKAKKIGQFQNAFGNVAAEVLREVYPMLPRDLKKKVKRVCDIWSDRAIFSKDVLKNIQNCLESNTASSSNIVVPVQLKGIVETFEKLNKVAQNKAAMKQRFDKAYEALDPSSVVYEENFKTVTKIGQIAKDTTSQTIHLRETCLEQLDALLKEQKGLLDEERSTLGEIDLALLSRNASNAEPEDNFGDNVLPTYEAEDDDDDDDDDDDKSSISEHSTTGQNADASEESNMKMTSGKRQIESPLTNDSQTKRSKHSSTEPDSQNLQEYEPETATANQTTSHNESGSGVTSNIQDLLSKLAN